MKEPKVKVFDGGKAWHLNGQLHREDGPALEYANGTKYWYLNGELHREEKFNPRNQVKELTIKEIEELLGFKIKVVGEYREEGGVK